MKEGGVGAVEARGGGICAGGEADFVGDEEPGEVAGAVAEDDVDGGGWGDVAKGAVIEAVGGCGDPVGGDGDGGAAGDLGDEEEADGGPGGLGGVRLDAGVSGPDA